ncbi:MAG TPA: DUF4954 family protein [Chitinophagaceae bacterium]|nr:DUF4954 family protein [Chitinophagaceae bacterium]HNM35171.1 DUF4954 family protein [Chitinophagaceae bacterium]
MPQNNIKKSHLSSLGYGFIKNEHIPKGKDEYYLRDLQNKSGINYRQLTAYEIEVLVRNRNTSDNWNNILVSNAFNPELVNDCKFYGLVRIGKLEPFCLEYSDLKVPVGLYNSTIISCDFGDNVCIDNVRYLSHYIIGNEVIIVNVNELTTTNFAKFGNGIIKQNETENRRIWLEICNENAGRSILPFNGMLTADAFLWSKYRDDVELLNKFKEFTEARFDNRTGYYGKVGHRTVIKNTAIIKDTWIGNDAYIKGSNKLKNLTINSGEEGKTQIGEGCELVNGIIDYGCRVFYGVKAVRFIMASHSQLKYGARLINSYLGNNATISCCEVLNSLIYPAHEQHHNNSFLCAALIMGQSNIAAGATIGSNHNSRAADGEIVAGRGFWPGLCVSLKHNSQFASYTILAKSDYLYELNIPIPFALVYNELSKNELSIMPGYWFMYNMYALARNNWKYIDRDKRVEKKLLIEYNYLAPDTINEMFTALEIMEEATGKAWYKANNQNKKYTAQENKAKGKELLLAKDKSINDIEILVDSFENSKRKVVIYKVITSYHLFKDLISFYATTTLLDYIQEKKLTNWNKIKANLPKTYSRKKWLNIGGQLMLESALKTLKEKIKNGNIKSWDAVHKYYQTQANNYNTHKLQHAIACLVENDNTKISVLSLNGLHNLLNKALVMQEWITKGISESREKDYTNEFRKMVYETNEEMYSVLGNPEKNTFINQQKKELKKFTSKINTLKKKIK